MRVSLRKPRPALRARGRRRRARTCAIAVMRRYLLDMVGQAPPVVSRRAKPLPFRSWGLPFLLRHFEGRAG